MSFHHRRRFLILVALFTLGVIISEAARTLWFPNAGFVSRVIYTLPWLVVAAGLGVLLDAKINHVENSAVDSVAEDALTPMLPVEDLDEFGGKGSDPQPEFSSLSFELDLMKEKYLKAEALAQSTEQRFRVIADHVQEGLTIFENERLVYINQRACEIFGDCLECLPERRVKQYACLGEAEHLQPILDGCGAAGEQPCELTYWMQRSDGARRCLREYYATVQSQELRRTFIVTSDITVQIQAYHNLEQAVEDRTRELSTVLEVSKKIATTLELEPLLNLILDQIETILPYSGAAIFILDGESLQVEACHVPSLSLPDRVIWLSMDRLGRYLPLIQEKKVMIQEDINGVSPLALAFQESHPHAGYTELPHARSWIGIPLVIWDRVLGFLSLTHSTPGYYNQNHVRLAQSITYQVAIAMENARLYAQAQNLATLEERNRIARELHDSVTQLLYGINLYCTATTRSLQNENLSQIAQNIGEIKQNALQALREMRLLILELNPPLLQKEGLVKALQTSLEIIETRTGLETELRTDGVQKLPHTLELDLYRIAMEALNNLVRYAQAKKVTVDIQLVNNWIFLEINDNGVGFDLNHARTAGGMGLQNMEQRARQLGGRLEIDSTPGVGTRIRAEVPI